MTKVKRKLDNIKCEKCGYQNHKKRVAISGVCHGCGAVLDEKVKFKMEMIKKLQLWRGKRLDKYEWYEIRK